MGRSCSFTHRFMAAGLLAVALPAAAAEWRTIAGVTPGVMYTDNVCQEPDNEQGEWIGLLTPDLLISGEGRRASASLAALVEMNTLSKSKLERLGCLNGDISDREQFAPRLRGDANTQVVADFLFLDVAGYIDQNSVNPFLPGGDDSLNRRGNTNTTYRYSISPYVDWDIGNSANTYLRYTYDDERNSEDQVADSDEELVDFALTSLPTDARFSWGLQANYDRVNYDESINQEATDSELRSAQVDLGLRLNRAWQVNGYVGEDDNDFFSVSDDIDGGFWDAGLRWTPNERTEAEIGYGDRFFGNTPRASLRHRHKRSAFGFSYGKEVTYNRNIRLQDNLLPDSNEFGQPVDPSTGQPLAVTSDATTLTNSPIVDERYTLDYAYQGRLSEFRLAWGQSDQERLEDGRDSVFRRATVSLDRELGQSFRVFGQLDWYEAEPKGESSEFVVNSETWSGVLGVERRLGQQLILNCDYRYTDQTSDQETDEYTENRVTLTLRYQFWN